MIVPKWNGKPIVFTKNSSNFPAKLTMPGMIIAWIPPVNSKASKKVLINPSLLNS